jgi:hypothetical protein
MGNTEKRRRIYTERNRVLKVLGFDSYSKYLESDTWKQLRAFVLKENPKCFACQKPSTQVHHTIYIKLVLEGKSTRGLIATCAGCHFKAEFRLHDGEKLNPKQATAKLKQMKTLKEKRKQQFVNWFLGEDK